MTVIARDSEFTPAHSILSGVGITAPFGRGSAMRVLQTGAYGAITVMPRQRNLWVTDTSDGAHRETSLARPAKPMLASEASAVLFGPGCPPW